MFELVKAVLLILLAGGGVYRAGVLTGWAGDLGVHIRVFGRSLAIKTYQFRKDKVYYRLALTPAISA